VSDSYGILTYEREYVRIMKIEASKLAVIFICYHFK